MLKVYNRVLYLAAISSKIENLCDRTFDSIHDKTFQRMELIRAFYSCPSVAKGDINKNSSEKLSSEKRIQLNCVYIICDTFLHERITGTFSTTWRQILYTYALRDSRQLTALRSFFSESVGIFRKDEKYSHKDDRIVCAKQINEIVAFLSAF